MPAAAGWRLRLRALIPKKHSLTARGRLRLAAYFPCHFACRGRLQLLCPVSRWYTPRVDTPTIIVQSVM